MVWKRGRPPRSILPGGQLVHYVDRRGECMLGLVGGLITGQEPEPIVILLLVEDAPLGFARARHAGEHGAEDAVPETWHWAASDLELHETRAFVEGRLHQPGPGPGPGPVPRKRE